MSFPNDSLSKFRAAYLDYIEGDRDEAPPLDRLNDQDRRIADAFIESSTAAAGIDPYASRPSIEQLLAGIKRTSNSGAAAATSQPPTPPANLAAAARRKQLRKVLPLAAVTSRGWIPATDDLDAVEAAVCDLLEIAALDESPRFAVAARRSNSQEAITKKQIAWLGHVRRMAEGAERGGLRHPSTGEPGRTPATAAA